MTDSDESAPSDPAATDPTVTVFWRPGCPYCSSLRRRLRGTGVPFDEVNIWNDPGAAAYVRSVAGGNETVPTVRIGEVAMVNPSAKRVVTELGRVAPHVVAGLAPGRSRAGGGLRRWLAGLTVR